MKSADYNVVDTVLLTLILPGKMAEPIARIPLKCSKVYTGETGDLNAGGRRRNKLECKTADVSETQPDNQYPHNTSPSEHHQGLYFRQCNRNSWSVVKKDRKSSVQLNDEKTAHPDNAGSQPSWKTFSRGNTFFNLFNMGLQTLPNFISRHSDSIWQYSAKFHLVSLTSYTEWLQKSRISWAREDKSHSLSYVY